jgi:hypothetical protein
VWWRTPLVPALGRQRQVDFCVRGQPGLQSEFQDSQDYTEKPCLKKKKKKKKPKKKKKKKPDNLVLGQNTEKNSAGQIFMLLCNL